MKQEELRRIAAKLYWVKEAVQPGDVLDCNILDFIFSKHEVSSVIHFAGLKSIGKSLNNPLDYYNNNVNGTVSLCKSMQKHKIFKLIFSSSATVYGDQERIPISDLRKILEVLSGVNNKNLSNTELSEIVRPSIIGLLIQQIAPLNTPLPIITFSGDLEQMILNIAKQSGENGLILESNLVQKIVTLINQTYEKLQAENKKPVLITAPSIRKDISFMLRQHIDNLDVLSFTELPDNKKIEVVATIGSDEEQKNN